MVSVVRTEPVGKPLAKVAVTVVEQSKGAERPDELEAVVPPLTPVIIESMDSLDV